MSRCWLLGLFLVFIAGFATGTASSQEATCSATAADGKTDRACQATKSSMSPAANAAGIVTITTQNFRESVQLTVEAGRPLFVAFYDPRSVSYKELWPALQETGRQLRDHLQDEVGAGFDGRPGPLALLGICDVTVHTYLGLREAPLLESSWQSTARGPFKFGKSRFHPMIIMIYVQGSILGEYVGVVSAEALLEVAHRLAAPTGGHTPGSVEESRALLRRPGPFVWFCGVQDGSDEANITDVVARKLHGHMVFVRASGQLCRDVFIFEEPLPLELDGPTAIWATSEIRAHAVLREPAFLRNVTALRRWVLSHRATIAQEMTPDNSHVFLDRPDPLLILLVDPEDKAARQQGESVLREVDQLFRHQQKGSQELNRIEKTIQYVWSDCNAYASQFDVQGKCPIFILVNTVDMDIKRIKDSTWVSNPNRTEVAQRLLQWLTRALEPWWPIIEEARSHDPDFQGPDQNAASLVIRERDHEKEDDDDDDDDENETAEERRAHGEDDSEDDEDKGDNESDGPRMNQSDPFWYSNVLEWDDTLDDEELPAVERFRNFHGLLATMADLKTSFEARHAGHVDFDWSELEKVQQLHPNMALLVPGPDAIVEALKAGREAMKPIWKRVEERDAVLTGLAAWDEKKTRKQHKKKDKMWRELREQLREGHRRLRELYTKLFQTLETLSRSGQLPTMGRSLSVARESAHTLSVRDFVEKYAARGQPVIIQDLSLTNEEWSLDFFKKTCERLVKLKQKNKSMWTWGKLEDAGTLPLAEFIDTFRTNETRRKWYLHDWPLPANCPAAFGGPPYEGFRVPKYFAGDYFQRAPFVGYQHTWPSLFVGSEETESALHVDSGGTNFWLYLLSGKKEWRFFSHLDMINLYHLPMSEHYFIDVFNSTSDEFPLLKHADLYTGIQEPGDLIFIPGGNPHGVRNLEAIHGISMNYVDASNIGSYLWTQLQEEQWSSFELFTDRTSLPHGLRSAQEDVSFGTWKSTDWKNVKDFDIF